MTFSLENSVEIWQAISDLEKKKIMREEARGIIHILIRLMTEMKERLKTGHKHSEHIYSSLSRRRRVWH